VDYLNGGKWNLVAEVTEIETGKNAERPKLAEALALCHLYRARLVVAKLDRLARNLHFLTTLMKDGVDFICCDMPTTNRLTIHILAAVAEAEAEMISTRTKAALAAAKARGVKLGNPRGLTLENAAKGRQMGLKTRQDKRSKLREQVLPVIEPLRLSGHSYAAIAAHLNERNIPAARGSRWSATQIFRLLR
jgi:DNA invertase Pin-like site-specific DNA recombinase